MSAPLRKLLIRTWMGPLPPWTEQWMAHIQHQHFRDSGWDFIVITNENLLRHAVKTKLGCDLLVFPGTRKAGDWDPMLGVALEEIISRYDFWGHCALDAVYGRIEKWLPDERLAELDVFGNDPGAICGPFSIYRNCPKVNNLFREYADWRAVLETEHYYGFDETEFSGVVNAAAQRGEIRFESAFYQEHDKQPWHVPTPRVALCSDGSLRSTHQGDEINGEEIMMFHFNRWRQWPCAS